MAAMDESVVREIIHIALAFPQLSEYSFLELIRDRFISVNTINDNINGTFERRTRFYEISQNTFLLLHDFIDYFHVDFP